MNMVESPQVHLVLRAHAPSPARVGVVYQPSPLRLAKAALSLAVFWGICPFLVWIPPHYPWAVLAFVTGAALAYRSWTGRYVVKWFAGECPRCGQHLRLGPGARISLPHTLICFGCHFEPRLEPYELIDEEMIAADASGAIRHVLADCAGSWRQERHWDQDWVVCPDCGARHHSTPSLLASAAEENERGRLLHELAAEGRFLT